MAAFCFMTPSARLWAGRFRFLNAEQFGTILAVQPFNRVPLATASSDSDQRKLKIDVLLNHFRTGLVCGFIPFFFSKKGAAVAALIFAASASLGVATGENAETGGTGKADAAFDKTLGQLIREPGGPPGAIAVVQRGHDVKVFRKGVVDQKTGAPIRVPDRWRIGSVSKAFNGAVALQLVAQGKLSLSDTIGQRLPTLPPAWHNVTLGQLLNHTSALPIHGGRRLAEGGPAGRVPVADGPDRPRERTHPRVPTRFELRVLEHR